MKEFAFLYPIPEYIDFEIKNHGWHEKGGPENFKKKYGDTLNQCIDLRYRQNGFGINYVIFNDHPISEVVNVQISDRIIKTDINYKKHAIKQPDGTHLYPDPDYILDQLPKLKTLTIGGFHLTDCVERFAKRAYERKLDVLVDEDLTELFARRLNDPNFKIDKFPSIDPKKYGKFLFEFFMNARKDKPWLWQKY